MDDGERNKQAVLAPEVADGEAGFIDYFERDGPGYPGKRMHQSDHLGYMSGRRLAAPAKLLQFRKLLSRLSNWPCRGGCP